MKCLAVAGCHDVSWHGGSEVTRRVHDSCAERRAGFGGEGEWRGGSVGGSVGLLGCPREPVRPRLRHHRRLACPKNLPALYVHEEGQTEKKNHQLRGIRNESKQILPTY